MSTSLYRKYRSRSLDEVVGQEHITQTLQNAAKNNSFSHAYLFTGPKGVGKTSVARILASLVNDIDYDKIANSLDIIEIDAASNRRIDEIRDLREKVNITPAELKYKVYIIDEVHMLTNEAFNALLKTLEEPPQHAIFVLATTELHKLPATIISRTQHFNFKPINNEDTISHLSYISREENIDIDQDALRLIAKHSSGSFRDAINLLQRVSLSSNHIDKKALQEILGLVSDELASEIISSVNQGNSTKLTKILNEYVGGAQQLASQLIDYLLNQQEAEQLSNLELSKNLLSVSDSKSQATLLKILLLEQCLKNKPANAGASQKIEPTAPLEAKKENKVSEKPKKTEPVAKSKPETQPDIISEPSDTKVVGSSTELWNEILKNLKTKHNTVYSIARMADVTAKDDKLTLGFKFPFHYKRFTDEKVLNLVNQSAELVAGKPVMIKCILIVDESKAPEVNTDLKNINNIFGDVEVLES